jgi:hypothetical protein
VGDNISDDYVNTQFKEQEREQSESDTSKDTEVKVEEVKDTEVKDVPTDKPAESEEEGKPASEEKVKFNSSANDGVKVKSTASITLKPDLNSRKLTGESTNQFEDSRRTNQHSGSLTNENEAFTFHENTSANENSEPESDDSYVNLVIRSCKMAKRDERRKTDLQKVDILIDPISGKRSISIEEDNTDFLDNVIYDTCTPRETVSETRLAQASQNSVLENKRKKVKWRDCVTGLWKIYTCINQKI